MLKMLKSPSICTTFFRFNIFDEKLLKTFKMLTPCAGDTTLLYVSFSSILGKLKSLRK